MMNRKIYSILSLLLVSSVMAQYPSGEVILKRIDDNMSSENRKVTSKMVIHGRRGSRTVTSVSWVQGEEKSFSEYLSPAREKGVKMLKLEDNLWMYSPSTDRIIQISGHMLKQSVMGSDLSYEDMMDDPHLTNNYYAVVTGTDTVDNRQCWIVELTAKTKDVTYFSRKLWVDRERNIPLREELFAKSGKLLKKTDLTNVKKIDNRWFPTKIVFKDVLKKGKGTEFIMEDIIFNVTIPKYIFTKAALR